MGILEDLGNLGNQAVSAVVNFGQDAGVAIDQATRNSIQFAASGVGANGQVFGPLADALGSNPTEFCLNLARKTKGASRDLLIRVATRTGKLSYRVPTPQGERSVTARPKSSASANQIALTLALCAMDSPATMAEEAGRMAQGQPVKARGLSGYSIYPMMLPAGVMAPETKARGLFLVDDAIILGIAVPILAAIAAAILPGLIAAAGNLLQGAIESVTGNKAPSAEEQAAAAAAAEEKKKSDLIKMVAVGGIALTLVGVIAYVLLRKKKAA